MEDIKKENKQEENKQEENKQEEAVTNKTELVIVPDSDTKIPEGAYVLTLAKPYTYEDKTYKELIFDFENLTGMDMISIETEMTTMGEILLSPEISLSFLSRMAARAARIGSDVILHLPFREFAKVKNRAQNFLIDTGFTERIL